MQNDFKDKLCEELWKECEPAVRSICNIKLSSNLDEIDDVIADTYLALCEAVENDKKIINPKAWLFGTANNKIKLKYKELKTYRERHRSISSLKYELSYNYDFLDAMITSNDIVAMKAHIISQLTDTEKLLLEFVYEDHLTSKEIAKIINTTEFAVKQRRYRLNNKIKDLAHDEIKKA